MSECTPTTEDVRAFYVQGGSGDDRARRHANFDLWLSEVRASVVSEEPEWEYGNEQLLHSHVEVFPASSEAVARAQAWLYPVLRRRKAGPWLPVQQEGTET